MLYVLFCQLKDGWKCMKGNDLSVATIFNRVEKDGAVGPIKTSEFAHEITLGRKLQRSHLLDLSIHCVLNISEHEISLILPPDVSETITHIISAPLPPQWLTERFRNRIWRELKVRKPNYFIHQLYLQPYTCGF